MLKRNHLGIVLGAATNTSQSIKILQLHVRKNKLKSTLILLLCIASCTIIETTIESTKRIGNAVIDETVDLGKVIISIPVDATKTIVDKIDEELHESDPKPLEETPLQQATPEEDKSIYTSLYGVATALLVALLILIFRFVFVNLLKGYR